MVDSKRPPRAPSPHHPERLPHGAQPPHAVNPLRPTLPLTPAAETKRLTPKAQSTLSQPSSHSLRSPLSPRPSAITSPTLPARDTSSREFAFKNADFDRVRKLIYKHAGISLSEAKHDMVYSRLTRRLRATGMTSFGEYLDHLDKGDKLEMERFVNSLTTNLTSFFREPHHFPLFAEHLKKMAGRNQIRVWCSAASTGEEPYSLAMTVAETFNGFSTPVTIIASDLDTHVLSIADKGIYSQDRVARLSPERLRRFFVKGTGTQEGFASVRPELRRMIQFQKQNLLDASYTVKGPIDVIFCRNVMIYFDKPTQYKILSRFVSLMQADGLLFAGHSESFLHAADLFRSRGKTVYELSRRGR